LSSTILLLTTDFRNDWATFVHDSLVVTPSFSLEGMSLQGKNSVPIQLIFSPTILTRIFIATIWLLLKTDWSHIWTFTCSYTLILFRGNGIALQKRCALEHDLSSTIQTSVFIATIGFDLRMIAATLKHHSLLVTPSLCSEGMTLLGKNGVLKQLYLSLTVLTWVFIATLALLFMPH